MKKKVFSTLLAFCLAVSGLSATAFAAGSGEEPRTEESTVAGEGIETGEIAETEESVPAVEIEESVPAENSLETEESTSAESQGKEKSTPNQIVEQSQLKENSWRYSDGVLIQENGERAVYSSDAWTKVDGNFINSRGEIIPNAVKKGIDVSEHQGVINWEAVKNSDVDFVIIRCGYGDNYSYQDDKQWLRNVRECERLGIPYGVYIYSYATTAAQARSEAQHVLRLLSGHNPAYPVYFDMEDNSTLGAQSQFAEFASIFCSTIEAAGYEAGVYANLYWWNTYLTDSRFSQWDRWVAQYNYQCDYQGVYAMWQSTSSGTVPGISGNVDINFLIGHWVEEGGNRYCYANGKPLTSQGYKIGGYWYYFGDDGAMFRNKWRVKGTDRYYYDSQGHMVSGQGMKINGYWYYFQTSGAMLTGWREKNGDRYYYDEEGHMVSGQGLKIGGYWYYFQTSGAMLTGWREKNGDRYYYDEEGHMVSGKGMKIDGYWYYFQTSGAMHTGWREKNGDRYYYGWDGRMMINETAVINGVRYEFDASGKALR